MPYDLPPWLQAKAPSEPFQAFLEGAHAGTAIGQQIVSKQIAGQHLSEQQRQFDIEQKFKQGIQQYQMEELSLNVQKMKLAKDYQFQTDRASVEIGNLVNTTPPDSPDFVSKLYGVAARYPAVMQTDVFKHASDLPQQSATMKLHLAEATKALAGPAPANAADEAAIANQVRDEEALGVSQGRPPLTPQERLRRTIELRTTKEFKPEMKANLGWDDQGRPIINIGGGAPTVATESFVQKNINQAEKNFELLDSLDKNLRTADLGAPGVIGEVVDRYAPQLGLPGFDAKRASNRTALKTGVQSMVRQISSDTRFSEADRKRAEDAMVSFGVGENKERATAVLGELKDIIRMRTRIDARTGGLPVPEFAMTPDEITKGVQSGKMTKEKGIELRLKYFPELYAPSP